MKIGISCYPTHGGSGVIATELGMALAERGHEIHFISYSVPFRLRQFQPNVFFHEVETMVYPLFKYPPYDLSLANKMAEVAQQVGLDIIHAHYAIPHAICAYLAKKMLRSEKLKIITTLHGTDITLVGADKSFFQIVKFSIEESDGITAVSHYLRRRTIEEFEIKKPIRVIYNFVDSERFNGEATACDKKRFAPRGEKILMHISNFRPLKRVCDVVRIFAKVREKIPSVLLLVGEGQQRVAVHQLVKELGLTKEVFFLGEQDYVEDLLACADLFLLPSELESFGLAALEAMSSKVPVIGSRSGGLPEVVVHGENGYLHAVGDVEKMAENAIQLLSNQSLLTQFKEKARQRAQQYFDANKLIAEYEDFYQKISLAF
ncbi:MAG: N-acetyl-alpha-D-glucosaminyl L-malate synthase BshA [Candidatus Zixiibacteriota bacterium]